MQIKGLIIGFVLSASVLTSPQLTLFASNSNFIGFVKWLQFQPAVSVQGKPVPQTSSKSHRYIASDYFAKLGSSELKVGLNFRLNDASDYALATLTKARGSATDHVGFAAESELLEQCTDDPNIAVIIDKAELVKDSFQIYATVKCDTIPDFMNAAAQKPADAAELLRNVFSDFEGSEKRKSQMKGEETQKKPEEPQKPVAEKQESSSTLFQEGLENIGKLWKTGKGEIKKLINKGQDGVVKILGDENGNIDVEKFLEEREKDLKWLAVGKLGIAKVLWNRRKDIRKFLGRIVGDGEQPEATQEQRR